MPAYNDVSGITVSAPTHHCDSVRIRMMDDGCSKVSILNRLVFDLTHTSHTYVAVSAAC
jgi:hypothetical protein